MKKLLLALPLIAGASWAGSTYYSGAQTEPAYNRLLDQLNDTGIFTVKSAEYEPGFTSSTAVTEVRLNHEDKPDILFHLEHKISHSPVSMVPENARFGAANIVTTLVTEDLEDEALKLFLKSFDTGEPFVLNTDVAIDGTTTNKMKINRFQQNDGDVDITADGASVNITTTPEGSVSGDGVMGDIEINNTNGQSFTLTGSKLDFDYEKIANLVFDLNFDMNIDNILVSDANISDQELFRLDNASYKLDQQLSGNNPHIKQSFGIANLASNLVPLQSVNFNSEFAGFSTAYMIENADIFNQFASDADPEAWIKSEEFATWMRETFVPDTSLSIDTDIKTTEGDADAAIKLWFVGNGSNDGYTGMATTGDLAKAIAGTATIRADKSAVMSTPLGEMLNEPVAQIYLKITDDTVSVDAKLEELLLTLNEQILPLEIMGGEMLRMPLESLLEM